MQVPRLLLTLLLVVLGLCSSTALAQSNESFMFVPITNTFASKDEGAAEQPRAVLNCRSSGGYLAVDASPLTHSALWDAAQSAGADSQLWYAYLGADTLHMLQTPTLSGPNECGCCLVPRLQTSPYTRFVSNRCDYRWDSGKWAEINDDIDWACMTYNIGPIAFKGVFYGNTRSGIRVPTRAVPISRSGRTYFPSYFDIEYTQDATGGPIRNHFSRPGAQGEQYLMAYFNASAGRGNTFAWSDNWATGGDIYANNPNVNLLLPGEVWTSPVPSPQPQTEANFINLCQVQTMSRVLSERPEATESKFQEVWWVVVLIVVFFICLVIFVLIWVCQEREDMDEPPEDAPEWAQEEAAALQRSKSFVSTRSFRQHDDDYDDADGYN